MLLSVVMASLVSATPTKVVMLPLRGVNTSTELLGFSSEHLAQALVKGKLEVITPDDVAAVVGLERQKQMLGCKDSGSSCLAELSGAMGANAILTGVVAKLGGTFQIDVKILNPADGKTLAAAQAKASSEEKLADALDEAARALVEALKEKRGGEAAAARGKERTTDGEASAPEGAVTASGDTGASAGGAKLGFWVPTIGGSVLAVGGAALLVSASLTVSSLTTASPTGEQLTLSAATEQFNGAMLSRNVGLGLVGAGAVAIVLGLVLGRDAGSSEVETFGFVDGRGGGGLAVRGVWP